MKKKNKFSKETANNVSKAAKNISKKNYVKLVKVEFK